MVKHKIITEEVTDKGAVYKKVKLFCKGYISEVNILCSTQKYPGSNWFDGNLVDEKMLFLRDVQECIKQGIKPG